MTTGAASVAVALETRLAAIASPLATQWENALYTPISGTPYQAVKLLMAQPLNDERSARYVDQGYMQVTLRYPIDTGKGTALAAAQAVRDWFYRGLSLAAGGVTVLITDAPEIAPASVDGDRYALPVKIRFRAWAT